MYLLKILIIAFIYRSQIDADSTSNNMEILRLQMRNAKENVENIIHRLQLLRNQAEEDTARKVAEKGDEEQDSYRSYKNLLITEIKVIIHLQSSKCGNFTIVYILIIYLLNKLLKVDTSFDKFVMISEISKKIYIKRNFLTM